MRLALIGAGRWGKIYIRTIDSLKSQRLSAICSRNPEVRNWIPADCQIFENWQEMLASKNFDALIICTPPSTHYEILAAAIEAKVPVLVEKPITIDLQQAKSLLNMSKDSSVPILVDHIHLFHPAYERMKELIQESGESIERIESIGAAWGPFREDYSSLWDYAPHDLSLTLDLLGEYPSNVKALKIKESTSEDGLAANYEINLSFANQVQSKTIVGNLFQEKERKFVVHTKTNKFCFNDLAADKLLHTDSEGNTHSIEISKELSLDRVMKAFALGVEGGEQKNFGLQLATQIVEVLTECDESIRVEEKK